MSRRSRRSRGNRVYCHLLPLVEQVEVSTRSWFVRVSPISRKHRMKPVCETQAVPCLQQRKAYDWISNDPECVCDRAMDYKSWLVVQCK